MNQEKFVNAYIDLLNSTINEAIQKNIVLQTQKKIIEEDHNTLSKQFNELSVLWESEKRSFDLELQKNRNELIELRKSSSSILSEKDELRKSLQHVDTFKNELVKSRIEIENKNSEIEILKKKLDSCEKQLLSVKTNKTASEKKKVLEEKKTVKDAGSF